MSILLSWIWVLGLLGCYVCEKRYDDYMESIKCGNEENLIHSNHDADGYLRWGI